MKQIIKAVGAYGLKLHGGHLEDGLLGFYSPEEGRIYFDIKLTPNERRTIIAHELGHAHYGHSCDSGKNERQADTYAAHLLIDPTRYAEAERVSADSHYLADELGVTADLVTHYQRYCLQRLGTRTYSTGHRSGFTSALARSLS